MEILFGDFNVNMREDDIFKPTKRYKSMREINNEHKQNIKIKIIYQLSFT